MLHIGLVVSLPCYIADLTQNACLAGWPWASMVGMRACTHLLRQAAVAQPESLSSPANPADVATLLKICWAWCLHAAACSVLPLQQRSLDLERFEAAVAAPAGPDPELNAFIDQWCAVVDQLHDETMSGMLPTNSDSASLLDVFDGRLWHFMLHCVSADRSTGLPPWTLRNAEGLMHAVCLGAGIAAADIARAISVPSASANSANGSPHRPVGTLQPGPGLRATP